MRSGATCSAGRAKKDWGRAGRGWEVVVAMGVALAEMSGGYWEGAGLCGIGIAVARTKKKYSAEKDAKSGIEFV